jgi:hypothetical protein
MTSTAVERHSAGNGVALFPGSNADEILAVAADVATKFGDVVKRQRMFRRIGESDHIQIEAWQTIGALTGVLAPTGVVTQLPWPEVAALGEEPPLPGREPRHRDSDEWRAWKRADRLRSAWEIHEDMLRARAMGKAYGFKCEFTATKNGEPVGWGEGSVDRNESNWVNKDDHELRAMSETRAQSRALGAPLKFVVKLAGYETTPAEELDGAGASTATPALPWGPVTDDDQKLKDAAAAVKQLAADAPVDAESFIVAMGQHFDGVPEACVTMLRGLARFIGDARAGAATTATAAADATSETPGPDPRDVYPDAPGGGSRYHGD